MRISREHNARLHLAVVVGYARLCLKMAERAPLNEQLRFATTHLEHIPFMEMPARLKDVAASEVTELTRDGWFMSDQGEEFVRLVQQGDYAQCWQRANTRLFAHDSTFAHVSSIVINPAWLL